MMGSVVHFAIVAASLTIVILWPPASFGSEENSCEICHGDIKVQYARSIHSACDISCVSCHGGDPYDLTKGAMAAEKGFRGVPAREDIPLMCAHCHSDIDRMWPFGEFYDQLSIYKRSLHGRALFEEGDPNVAICTDCHGAHGILEVEDPEGRVAQVPIVEVCSSCHSDEAKMAPYGLPTGQSAGYRAGVHWRALVERNDLGAPSCPDCHGSHGATPPGVDEIEIVCGRCHVAERSYFDESPHAPLAREKKFKQCVDCHGAHEIMETSPDLFYEKGTGTSTCVSADCHQADSEAVTLARRIRERIGDAQEQIAEAVAKIETARSKGFDVAEELLKVKEAKARLIQVTSVSHSLSLRGIEEYTRYAETNAEEVRDLVEAKLIEFEDRRVLLAGYILLFLLLIVLLLMKRRAIHRQIKVNLRNPS